MADRGVGFLGRFEVVEPRGRGRRRWPTEFRTQIVAESLQSGARVCDVRRAMAFCPLICQIGVAMGGTPTCADPWQG